MNQPQKYAIGTTFQKEFPGHGFFEGTVIQYLANTGCYRAKYDDGDQEELDEYDMDRIIVGDKLNQPQKYEIGTSIRKEFPGYGFFEGTLMQYDPHTACYKARYKDGDEEELDELDIDQIILGNKMYHPQKHAIGTTFRKEFPRYGFFEGTIMHYEPKTGCYQVKYEDGDEEVLNELEIDQIFLEEKMKGPQKYAIGTTIRKEFAGHGFFTGTLVHYEPATGRYRVKYEDGDQEELDNLDIDRIILGEKMNRPQKHEIGTTFRKEFPGYGLFKGTIVHYEPATGRYRVEYEDGEEEELDELDIGRIILGLKMNHPQKHPIGTTFCKEFLGYGFFEGTIIHYERGTGQYRVKYEDGDHEVLNELEIDQIILQQEIETGESPKNTTREPNNWETVDHTFDEQSSDEELEKDPDNQQSNEESLEVEEEEEGEGSDDNLEIDQTFLQQKTETAGTSDDEYEDSDHEEVLNEVEVNQTFLQQKPEAAGTPDDTYADSDHEEGLSEQEPDLPEKTEIACTLSLGKNTTACPSQLGQRAPTISSSRSPPQLQTTRAPPAAAATPALFVLIPPSQCSPQEQEALRARARAHAGCTLPRGFVAPCLPPPSRLPPPQDQEEEENDFIEVVEEKAFDQVIHLGSIDSIAGSNAGNDMLSAADSFDLHFDEDLDLKLPEGQEESESEDAAPPPPRSSTSPTAPSSGAPNPPKNTLTTEKTPNAQQSPKVQQKVLVEPPRGKPPLHRLMVDYKERKEQNYRENLENARKSDRPRKETDKFVAGPASIFLDLEEQKTKKELLKGVQAPAAPAINIPVVQATVGKPSNAAVAKAQTTKPTATPTTSSLTIADPRPACPPTKPTAIPTTSSPTNTAAPATATPTTTQRRSKRKRVATVVNVDGYDVKADNNYVVKGTAYVYQERKEETPSEKAAKTKRPKRQSKKKTPAKQRKMAPCEVLRSKHNKTVKSTKHGKEPRRRAFFANSQHILEPFLENKTIRLLEVWNEKVGGKQFYMHHELFVQPESVVGGELRDYQLAGLNFLSSMYNQNINCILGDEMGLGKTLQTISFLCHLKAKDEDSGPSLVVCPLSVYNSWQSELEKWAPSLRVLMFHMSSAADRTQRRGELIEAIGKYDVIVVTYEMIGAKDLIAMWRRLNFRCVVLDEGHRIKGGDKAHISVAARKLQSEFRLLLTGTPLQNNLVELFFMLNFLHPDIFTTVAPFQNAFVLNSGTKCRIDTEKLSKAQQMLSLFMLRREKEQVEKLLPKKLQTKLYVPLSRRQVELYKSMLLDELDTLAAENRPEARAARAKVLRSLHVELRKVCNHPFLIYGTESEETPRTAASMIAASGKLAVLDLLLRSLFQKSHRVVIFSQFTSVLDLLAGYCLKRGWTYSCYDGRMPRAKRNHAVEYFNSPAGPFLFLMSTRAGNLGLNLQAGSDTVIIFDSDPNPQVDLQAQSRVHRLGQSSTCHVYRLISAGTVEERALEGAEKKLFLDKMVNTTDKMSASNRDVKDKPLAVLQDIKFGSAAVFGDRSLNMLPTKEDIEFITNRSRDEKDSHGKLKGNAFHNMTTFDAQQDLTGAQEYKGVDFKKLREERQKLLRASKPLAVQELETSWDGEGAISQIGDKKRQRKSRFTIIEGEYCVLNANNYDLAEGEASVFDRELANSNWNRERFRNPKRERQVINDCQIYCQHCGDGGELHRCEACPVAVHKECCPIILRQYPRCAHHWCSVCIKETHQVGGILYPCQSCPNAYCESCLPRHAKGFRIVGKCDRFEALGFDSTRRAVYIHCSEQCELYAKSVWGWVEKSSMQTLPPEIDVSGEFGDSNDIADSAGEPDAKAPKSQSATPPALPALSNLSSTHQRNPGSQREGHAIRDATITEDSKKERARKRKLRRAQAATNSTALVTPNATYFKGIGNCGY